MKIFLRIVLSILFAYWSVVAGVYLCLEFGLIFEAELIALIGIGPFAILSQYFYSDLDFMLMIGAITAVLFVFYLSVGRYSRAERHALKEERHRKHVEDQRAAVARKEAKMAKKQAAVIHQNRKTSSAKKEAVIKAPKIKTKTEKAKPFKVSGKGIGLTKIQIK